MPEITKDDYTDKCIDDVKRNDDSEYKLIERKYNDNKINDGKPAYYIEYINHDEPRNRINLLDNNWLDDAESKLPHVSGIKKSEKLITGLNDMQTAAIRFYAVAGYRGDGNHKHVNMRLLKMVKYLGTKRYAMHDFLVSLNESDYGEPQPTWIAHTKTIKDWYKRR